MPPLLRCSNGHSWEAPAGPLREGSRAVCPVCGSIETTLFSPPLELPSRVPAGPARASEARAEKDDPFPVIPGYEILEVVGRGGMGIVYRAIHQETNRVVALKVIRRDRLLNPESIQRFRREARAAARLCHPNIVVIHDSDQEGDTHYLALEYVPGITLQQLVEEQGPVDVELACDFVRQTALGLQHAAEQGLVHRDIKPANLMIVAPPGVPRPRRPLVKVLDMGVARIYGQRDGIDDSLTTLTRDGVVIGTPDYIAPEQLENPHGADIRADLYSLGCTFYFLLSGQVPFPGGTLIQKLDRQRWHTAPSVDQLRPDVPRPVAAVIRRLMAKHPDDRYRSPAELAEALAELCRTGELPAAYQPVALKDVRCYLGHEEGVVAGLFTPDGARVLSAGADRTIRVWQTAGGQGRVLARASTDVACMALVPPAGPLLVGQGARVRSYDLATGRDLMSLSGHTDAVRAVAVSQDGRLAITAGDDRTLRLWNLHTGRQILRMTGCRSRISCVAISADGHYAVSGDHEPTLRLWDMGNGREIRRFPVPRGAILAVSLSPDGRAIASGHFDTTLRLWDPADGRELRRCTGHRQMLSSVAFAPDGLRVASGSHDRTVNIWDVLSGADLWCCQGHDKPVTSVAFSPDGSHLLSASQDGTLRLWKMPD